MTKVTRVMLASAAFFALQVGPTMAGPCSDQIADLRKTLSTTDAGSGPTLGANPSNNQNAAVTGRGATATGSTQGGTSAASGQGSGAASAGSATVPNVSADPAQARKAGEAPKTDATVAMNTATQGSAASPQDVRSQLQGQPTASQAAQSSIQGGGTAPQGDRVGQINAALERARVADEQGKSQDCMSAVEEAKRLTR